MSDEKALWLAEEQTRIILATAMLAIIAIPSIWSGILESKNPDLIIMLLMFSGVTVLLGAYLVCATIAFVPPGTLGAKYIHRTWINTAHSFYWMGAVLATIYIVLFVVFKAITKFQGIIGQIDFRDVIIILLVIGVIALVVVIFKLKKRLDSCEVKK